MQLLSELKIKHDGKDALIQLLQGDLTAIPKEHQADILVISAYPGQYGVIDKKTLMAGLYYNGLIVADLAKHKAVDLTDQLHCWLSEPLPPVQQQQFNFRQILCFEPPNKEGKEKVVSNIFRCINTFAFDKENNVIAMPVLASGNQKVPMEIMLPALLEAAIFWLQKGLPLECIKLVLHTEEQVEKAVPIFEKIKKHYHLQNDPGSGLFEHRDVKQPGSEAEVLPEIKKENTPRPYDFFISYSHVQSAEVQKFVEAFTQKNKGLNIFFDKSSIPAGGLWIRQISEAIQNSKVVLCILSPQYSRSDVCWDEFQCAKALEYRSKRSVIKTINLYNDTELPLMMSIYSYIDCTEGNLQKLIGCVEELLT